MNRLAKTLSTICMLLAVSACANGSESGEDTETSPNNDTMSVTDTMDEHSDSERSDPDTAERDTSVADTAPSDSGTPDSGREETGVDSGRETGMDSGLDTATDSARDTADTASADTGSDADTVGGTMSVRQLRSTVSLQPGDSTSKQYTITDVIVTAVDADGAAGGFFVQDNSAPPENSGIWIYMGNNKLSGSLPTIDRGTVLELTGKVTNYDNAGRSSKGGLLELEAVSRLNVLQQGATLPQPVQVSGSDVALSGSDSETYEGVLIEVTNAEAASAPGNFSDTELTSGLYIGPEMYNYTMDFSPTAGTTYSSIVGPLNFSFDKTEISPRDMNDITP